MKEGKTPVICPCGLGLSTLCPCVAFCSPDFVFAISLPDLFACLWMNTWVPNLFVLASKDRYSFLQAVSELFVALLVVHPSLQLQQILFPYGHAWAAYFPFCCSSTSICIFYFPSSSTDKLTVAELVLRHSVCSVHSKADMWYFTQFVFLSG